MIKGKPTIRNSTINASARALRVKLGLFEIKLPARATNVLDAEFGTHLAPGVHRLSASDSVGSSEIWLSGDEQRFPLVHV